MRTDAMLSLAALRQLEQGAAHHGLDLMAQAARATADWVGGHLPPGVRVLVAAGPGNNGGDALQAALLLHQRGYHVDLLLPAIPTSPATQAALQALLAAGLQPRSTLAEDAPPPDLIIDGLFGIGLARDFAAPWLDTIRQLNALAIPVLALDTPSGLDPYRGTVANVAIRASHTLTFLSHKPGLYMAAGADLAGQVELAPLDYPSELCPATEGELNRPLALLPARANDSHKGRFGCVLVIGGAHGMLGAALLAGRAAYAGGAGKVHLATLDDRLAVDPAAPELMIQALEPSTTLPRADAVAIGPGLGQGSSARQWLARLLDTDVPLLLDADALNLLAGDSALQQALSRRQGETVLTPHPAEAARLLACSTAEVQADRLAAARTLAQRLYSVVVLKGAGSLIVRPDGYYRLNTSGGPALAVAGQGDVLSGLVAALLAQGLPAFDAAALGVHLHGLAGDAYTRAEQGPVGLTAAATVPLLSRMINQARTGVHG
ncbi:bifunctional ADP-dependent NAD(P)H-hydrate dehydratase/NAD(P)H-hydrate epimerase [Pseudogulbenkiania sp. NH8B]|uniref:bifunctional ADP-dependent NAD(P)H-hydrate dehydratase/NAD(P)H-hydrate epimerase n=1 Tax=Pseudogulbenkiania sp. (strain NH8B) TaxID=748280 RepID=UPI000300A87B|nr:bifunctional ADP-dependent NAD(P)H-hydrate dehydratase/NAD(P)H-hydrate epimerase [Pseudogulbenkiania sp. NH8B]